MDSGINEKAQKEHTAYSQYFSHAVGIVFCGFDIVKNQ
jgi:hypothetical protein